MKHLLALMALCVAFAAGAQSELCGEGTIWDEVSGTCVSVHISIDSNADGLIGVEDLLSLLSYFGDTDLDFDGVFDSIDLCTDLDACNYIANPTEPCGLEDALGECNGPCADDFNGDGICDSFWGPCLGESFISFQDYNYSIIEIGSQCWFAENLKTSNYSNGDMIPNITSNTEWANSSSGASCIWQNDSASFFSEYGRFYNWFAVNDLRGMCPIGWRVPSAADFDTLANTYGGNAVAGYALKSLPPVWDGSDESGFEAIKTGYRNVNGGWIYQHAVYWLSDSIDPYHSMNRFLTTANMQIGMVPEEHTHGFSIRCLKD